MYSQHEEEKHIIEFFDGKTNGTLIDVGAYDGRTFSNSLKLIETGWSGILIEPSAKPFRDLIELHGRNPRLRLVNAAVVAVVEEPLIKLHVTDDAISTTSEEFRQIWAAVANYLPAFVAPVAAIDIVQFFRKSFRREQPDFVNIDTEGTTLSIASALAVQLKPAVWCIEYRVGATSSEDQLRHLFNDYYVTYQSAENLLFTRKPKA